MAYTSKKLIIRISSDAAQNFVHTFTGMPDRSLKATIERAKSLSETNCGWTEYRMKKSIISICEQELKERAFAKQQKKKQKDGK